MLLKWAIGGFVVGALAGLYYGDVLSTALFGSIVAVAFRKWLFEKLWM